MPEYRRLYWRIRDIREEAVRSRTHLFPEDRQTALCGRKWPRDKASTVQADAITEFNRHLCQRCLTTAKRCRESEASEG